MTGRRIAAGALATAVQCVLVWAAVPRAASADSLQVDWWKRDASVTAPVGGFAVADDVDGAVAVAAVRVHIDQAVTSAVLIAPASKVDTGTAIVACPATTGWGSAQGGDFAQAPKSDCSRVSAPFTANGNQWRVDLHGIIGDQPGTFGVVLLPAPGPLARTGVAVGVDVTRFKSAFGSPGLEVAAAAAPATDANPSTPNADAAAPAATGAQRDLPRTIAAETPGLSALPPGLGQVASIAPFPSGPTAPTTPTPHIALPITRTADRLTAGGALWRIAVAIIGGVLAALLHSRRDLIAERWGRIRAALPVP